MPLKGRLTPLGAALSKQSWSVPLKPKRQQNSTSAMGECGGWEIPSFIMPLMWSVVQCLQRLCSLHKLFENFLISPLSAYCLKPIFTGEIKKSNSIALMWKTLVLPNYHQRTGKTSLFHIHIHTLSHIFHRDRYNFLKTGFYEELVIAIAKEGR